MSEGSVWSCRCDAERRWRVWSSLSCSWPWLESSEVFTIKYGISWAMHVDSFHRIEEILFSSLSRVLLDLFVTEGCWIWSSAFSVSIEIIMWFLAFFLFILPDQTYCGTTLVILFQLLSSSTLEFPFGSFFHIIYIERFPPSPDLLRDIVTISSFISLSRWSIGRKRENSQRVFSFARKSMTKRNCWGSEE